MPLLTRLQVDNRKRTEGVNVFFNHPEQQVCICVITASCYNNRGIRLFEFINRRDYAHKEIARICDRRKICRNPGWETALVISIMDEYRNDKR